MVISPYMVMGTPQNTEEIDHAAQREQPSLMTARMLQNTHKGFQLSPVTGPARGLQLEGGPHVLKLVWGKADESSLCVDLDSQEGEVQHGTRGSCAVPHLLGNHQLLHGHAAGRQGRHTPAIRCLGPVHSPGIWGGQNHLGTERYR